MAKILLVEDEANTRRILSLSLQTKGHEVDDCPDSEHAFKLLNKEIYDIVLTDLRLHGRDTGLDIIRKSTELQPNARVLLVTAYASLDTAVAAMREGAFDYLTKPVSTEDLTSAVERGLADREGKPWNDSKSVPVDAEANGLIGSSVLMERLRDRIIRVAGGEFTVLILGESGTGKELAAQMVHRFSNRSSGPFVPIHCGAIPMDLFEAELFGYKKGSFTGAGSDRSGLIESANGGTLFLDEISEMPKSAQVKLLRVLQDHQVRRLGEEKERKIDMRVIAASNRDLSHEVESGKFREDLFYRLNVVPIYMPPLRYHREDIEELSRHFIGQWSDPGTRPKLDANVLEKLKGLPFAGNVRELENLLQRMLALSNGGLLDGSLLNESGQEDPNHTEVSLDALCRQNIQLDDWLNNIEKNLISQALDRSGGNITRAADFLGISFRSLRYRLHKLGLHGNDE
ncbi:MAG: sigma-54-dependent transcriptional regulator [Mariprofundaceae bacterium]